MARARRLEELDEALANRDVHEQSGAGETHLAAVVVHQRRLLGGGPEVGVREDQEGTLATEFGGEGHEVLGGALADDAPRLR